MARETDIEEESVEELRARLQEAEDTLEAIRLGAVDALVVSTQNEHEIFTLRSADYTYRMLIESMNQGALTINFDGTILYSNRQFSNMLEEPLEKVIGNSIMNFTSSEDHAVIEELLCGDQGDNAMLEINLRTASGSRLTVIASATTVTQADVKPYLCVVITDMTERKQAEEAKDEFISLASHQLRTPATAVKQYVNMLLDGIFGDVTPAQRDALERADASNERELKIVEDLLKVAQIDAGKIILNRTSCDFADLIGKIVKDQASQIEARDQSIIYDPPKEKAVAYIDEALIRMAVENLIDNASKYMMEGGTITVSVTPKEDTTLVSVTDEGVGMSEQDVSRLFQKFSRLPNSLSIKVGGNGLGLYWVKKVVDLHDADISVASAVGKGTTFTIALPKGEPRATHSRRRR